MKIAIIGAGLSGITAAKTLITRAGAQMDITIFEKSRGAGGRMSTRRTEEYEFDHGAQYFTAKDPTFKTAVKAAIEQGHVAPWHGVGKYLKNNVLEDDLGGARYVATPRMNSWIKDMAAGLNMQTSMRVSGLVKAGKTWTVKFDDGQSQSGFDSVISSIPSPQAEQLLGAAGFPHLESVKSAKMEACFSVMLGFKNQIPLPWDTLRSADGPASWIAHNSAKPGRPNSGSTLMLQSGPNWSEANIERDKADLQTEIITAASSLTGHDLSAADYITIHRWLYAAVSQGAVMGENQACLVDSERKLVCCGDWCVGGRVEGAWLSGKAAAEAVLNWR